MKILVSGSNGLVGSALLKALGNSGNQVISLVRRQSPPQQQQNPTIQWDPDTGQLDANQLEGVEAVVHLAGENIAARRWTEKQKAKIRDSRIKGTTFLSETLARLDNPPGVLIAASAIGYYGDSGAKIVHEGSPSGTDYLSDVCRAWEDASSSALKKGIRVVHLRFGIILSTQGGALAAMLPPFQLGVGGKMGHGHQYMSWISLDDAVGTINHTLFHQTLTGPVNGVTSNPVTNLEFTKTLGKVLSRPTLCSMPSFVARLAFGEMANALLLSSTRVEPRQLTATGYEFNYPNLEGALRHLLKNKAKDT